MINAHLYGEALEAETTRKIGVEIQIGTKSNRLLARVAIGFLPESGGVHRTVVNNHGSTL